MSLPCKEEDYYDDPIILFDQAELRSFEKEHYNFTNTCDEPLDVKFSSEDFIKDTNLNGSFSQLPQPFFYIPDNLKLLNQCRPLIIKIVDCEKHPWYYKKYLKMGNNKNEMVPVKSKSVCKINDVRNNVLPKVSTFRSKFKCISDYPDASGKITSSKIKGEIDFTAAGVSTGNKNKIEIDFQKNKGLEGMKIKLVFELHDDRFNKSKKAIKLETNKLKEPKKNIKSKNLKSSSKDGVGVSTSANQSCIKPKENIINKMQNKIPCKNLPTNPVCSPKIILGNIATPRKVVSCIKNNMVSTGISDVTNVTKTNQCVNNYNDKDNYTIEKNSLNDTTYIFKKMAENDKVPDNVQSANVTSTENVSSNNATKSILLKSKSSPKELGKIKKPIKRAPKKSKCGNAQPTNQQYLEKTAVDIYQSQPKKKKRKNNNNKMNQDPKLDDRTKIINSPVIPDITITASKNDIFSSYGLNNLNNTNENYQGNIQQAKNVTNSNQINKRPTVANYTGTSIDSNIKSSSTECKNKERLPTHTESAIDNNFLAYNTPKIPVKYNYEKNNVVPQITQYGQIQRNAINIKPIPISTSQNNNKVRSGHPIQTLVSGTLKDQRIVNIQASVPVSRPHFITIPKTNGSPIINQAPQQQQAFVNHSMQHNYQMPRNTLLETPPPPYFNRFDNFGIKHPPAVPMHIPQNHKGNMITNTVAENIAYNFNQLPNCPLYTQYFPYYMTTVPPPPLPTPVRIIEENLQQQSNAVSSTKNVVGNNVNSYGIVKKINLQSKHNSITNGLLPRMEEQNGKQMTYIAHPPTPTKSFKETKLPLYNKDQNVKQITQYTYASSPIKSVTEGNLLPTFTKDYSTHYNQNTYHTYKPTPTKSVTEEKLLLIREKDNGKQITPYTNVTRPTGSVTLDTHHCPKNFNEIEGDHGMDHNKIAEKIIMEIRNKTDDSSRESQQVANLRNTLLPHKGYSPPILPIPTYENGLDLLVKASLENSVSNVKEDSNKIGDVCEKKKKRKLKEYDDNGSPKKKISIEEYKNRGKRNSQNIIDLTTEDMNVTSQ